ncbi:MAG: hypothetical protein F9K37_05460 [Bacteroidales bacterium]|nr:MAG: hypothetical protein F9K37_05460 [Bacteroidales bacterium]
MSWIKSNKVKLKAKRAFLKKGTCSRTFFYILNREFGHPKDNEEQAADYLAGGILQSGYQCGMLWGASLAVGAESYRRFNNQSVATGMAIKATQNVLDSFIQAANSPDCGEITNTDWKRKYSILKFLVTGKMVTCFKLAGKWAPDAVQAANDGLSQSVADLPATSLSCASEVVKRMGGTDEEMVIVAGLAGGIGLSGNACGALGAAIWMNSLQRVKNGTFKSSLTDSESEKILNAFLEVSNYEMECSKICGKQFESVEEHSEYIMSGGCQKLIETLGRR